LLAVEQRRGVGQARVEELLEQLVRQVVVVSGVAPRVGPGAALAAGGPRDGEAAELLPALRYQPGQVTGQHGQDGAEVGSVPGPGEVRLAEPDQQPAPEPGEELVGPMDGQLRTAHPEGSTLEMDGDREPSDGGLEQAACDVRRDGGAEASG